MTASLSNCPQLVVGFILEATVNVSSIGAKPASFRFLTFSSLKNFLPPRVPKRTFQQSKRILKNFLNN